MRTEPLTSSHQSSLAVLAFLLLSGRDLFGKEMPREEALLTGPQPAGALVLTPAERGERLAA